MKRQVGLKLEHELVRRVDEARGGVSRAAWIRLALEERLSRGAAASTSSGRVLSGAVFDREKVFGGEPELEFPRDMEPDREEGEAGPAFVEAYYSSPAVSHRPGCSCLVCLGS